MVHAGDAKISCPSLAHYLLTHFLHVHAAVAVLTVDRGGRRPLLLLGVAGMVLSALMIGVAVLVSYASMTVTYLSIAGLFIFVGSYQARSCCCFISVHDSSQQEYSCICCASCTYAAPLGHPALCPI